MIEARYKIDKITAEKEFERFCVGWDIDDDFENMNEDDEKDFSDLKRKIIRAIRLGRLTYDKSQLNYKLVEPLESVKELIIKRPKGNSYLKMDRFKDKESMHKAYAIYSDMVDYPIAILAKLDGIDNKVLQAIATLFLAS